MKHFRIVRVSFAGTKDVYYVETQETPADAAPVDDDTKWKPVQDISTLAAVLGERPRAFTLSSARTFVKNEKLAEERKQVVLREVVE